MRLDIASYAADRTIDGVILVTGDTDCLLVMERARVGRVSGGSATALLSIESLTDAGYVGQAGRKVSV